MIDSSCWRAILTLSRHQERATSKETYWNSLSPTIQLHTLYLDTMYWFAAKRVLISSLRNLQEFCSWVMHRLTIKFLTWKIVSLSQNEGLRIWFGSWRLVWEFIRLKRLNETGFLILLSMMWTFTCSSSSFSLRLSSWQRASLGFSQNDRLQVSAHVLRGFMTRPRKWKEESKWGKNQTYKVLST